MADAILEVRELRKAFGALAATDGISLEVREGETHAIIGPNGAGKTTLISQLAGNLRPDSGSIRFAGEDVTRLSAPQRAHKGFARSFQITSIYRDFTALDNVALAVQAHAGHSFRFWRPAREERALRDPARAMLAEVGLGARADVLAANLAHGEQRQLEVAMASVTDPKVIMLDEPASGLSRGERERLTELLLGLPRDVTLVLIEHDMDVALTVAEYVTMMHDGRKIVEGTPDEIRANQLVHDLYLGSGHYE